jgi:hypothetical protein
MTMELAEALEYLRTHQDPSDLRYRLALDAVVTHIDDLPYRLIVLVPVTGEDPFWERVFAVSVPLASSAVRLIQPRTAPRHFVSSLQTTVLSMGRRLCIVPDGAPNSSAYVVLHLYVHPTAGLALSIGFDPLQPVDPSVISITTLPVVYQLKEVHRELLAKGQPLPITWTRQGRGDTVCALITAVDLDASTVTIVPDVANAVVWL